MAMIEFVRNYSDHSTDRGYQFQFNCDQCGNGYMSSYETSMIGTAGGLLQAAGSLFGGILGNAGRSSYEIQRAIGGPAHDHALQKAVAEVKEKFRRCQRCGKWVCAEICWNERAAQCVGCNPKYEQEVISLRTHAQIQATGEQLNEKAHGIDYVSGIDMNPDSQVRLNPAAPTPELPPQKSHFLPDSWQSPPYLPQAASTPAWSPITTQQPTTVATTTTCASCGTTLSGSKFCPGCGAPTAPSPKTCSACGHVSASAARFCEDCGGKLA